MSINSANARLIPQFEAHKHTLHLIHRYSKLSPTRGAVTQDPEADELRAQIHQRLRAQEEEFELFRQEFEDQKNSDTWISSIRRESSAKERERTDLAAQVAQLGEDLKLWDIQIRIFFGLLPIRYSGKLNYKLNATLKLFDGKSERPSLRVVERVTVRSAKAGGKGRKGYLKTKPFSMRRAM
ncbi:MAG: hypothetical protein Q9214_007597 [Letrouitia sp. 1 TL-2023]